MHIYPRWILRTIVGHINLFRQQPKQIHPKSITRMCLDVEVVFFGPIIGLFSTRGLESWICNYLEQLDEVPGEVFVTILP